LAPPASVIADPMPTTSPSASSCEPYRDLITRWVDDRRTAMSIWQELVEKLGFSGRHSAVGRFVRKLQGTRSPEARVVIATRPGEEAQVDYGDGPMVRHPVTQKYRRTRLFLLTLADSRKSVRLLTWKSSTKIWAQLHEQAFRRLGGATATVVLDNLREGVLEPDVYDPLLNPLYRDVLAHYDAVALPCRVRDPDRKGKVESGIHHTQRALRGLRFESLEEAQTWLDNWDERWADTRIHGTTKRQVAAMFADERSHLRPLPVEPFRYYAFGDRGVHLDGYVEIAGAYYAPPPGWIGRSVRVQWDETHVRLLDPNTGVLLREHVVADRGHHAACSPTGWSELGWPRSGQRPRQSVAPRFRRTARSVRSLLLDGLVRRGRELADRRARWRAAGLVVGPSDSVTSSAGPPTSHSRCHGVATTSGSDRCRVGLRGRTRRRNLAT
jgi:transposase